jgi:hypothetical protein
MFQSICILHGEMLEGELLNREVFNEDGSPYTGDYRGEAVIEGSKMRITQGYSIRDFTLGQYTTRSIEQHKGYMQGLKQTRMVRPGYNTTSDYSWGWAKAWQEKGRDPYGLKR